MSLRGAKRRSNPERDRVCTGLPRPKGLAMTGELIDTIFLRKVLGGDTFIYALFDNKTNYDNM